MSKIDGEYELVLGNRQLLSAFFIIVILFGVFFTMGYVVGRNSAPAAASVAASNAPGGARPEAPSAVSPPPSQPASPAAEESKPPAESKPAEAKETHAVETRVEAQPVKPPETAQTPPRSSSPAVPPSFHAPMPVNPAAAHASGVPAITPGPGRMYLQVAAAAEPQAGVVVDTLKQKGFPALLAQGPNPALFRVLVGPYADAAALGKAKAALENAGFHPMVRK
ncbi:MAG TPA: SPOR domain-containing protein [Bryobacteraceae bacterium]|nr:SPOR domain-containing protein [Bryobacteraceae bacterium]